MIWPFQRRDWTPSIQSAVDAFLTLETTDAIHTQLLSTGLSSEQATKLLLFVPCAFAREMFEPEGVQFSDDYFRSDGPGTSPRRKSYLREPIYQQARAVARRFIEHERFTDLRIVVAWSAEGDLIQQAIEQGCLLNTAKMAPPIHNF
jgi:hypothetical protein